ncbi:MAG: HAMP domain-containing sensor histidine kinase [Vibrio hibernica]
MNLHKCKPKSLVNRTSIILMVVIISVELFTGFLWYKQNQNMELKSLQNEANNLALSSSSTVSFLVNIPRDYRYLVINQLRDIGGNRFFVSLNNHKIDSNTLPASDKMKSIKQKVETELSKQLSLDMVNVDFTLKDDLKVLNSEVFINELPNQWSAFGLSNEEDNPPVLVIQVKIKQGDWFYLAAMLPMSYLSENSFPINSSLIFLIVCSAVLIFVISWLSLRKEIKPIRNLAKAATQMDLKSKSITLKQEGSVEIQAAIYAFNKMDRRIKSFIIDREMLFRTISHDLRTPLACLKLRTEMLDDPITREKFEKSLNDIDKMAKDVLQCMSDTDIHEELDVINIEQVLKHCASPYSASQVQLPSHLEYYILGKPLAVQRCMQNIIDNGIKYGEHVSITVDQDDMFTTINFIDDGIGIDSKDIEKVFEPYFRGDNTLNLSGTGLGLSIAYNIMKSHGGDIKVQNNSGDGITVQLKFINNV